MTTYPNCKINLGLHIVHRRDDGYHDIESIFIPVMSLRDELVINPLPDLPAGECLFQQQGLALDNEPADNLCAKAYRLLRDEFGSRVGAVSMTLNKKIPFGAGLGGGSADAAFTLKMLNQLFSLGLTDDELCLRAARLGADCPFFILNRPMYVSGIGDRMEPVEIDLDSMNMTIEIVKPDDCVSTREAYSGITPRDRWVNPSSTPDLRHAILQPVTRWRDLIVNDFEAHIASLHPAIAATKKALYERGALYASMTGSGSAVFGLFYNKK